MRSDIQPGATFPDYELPDHTGTRRRLSELQGGDPMILVLSRGHFCPKDRRQHLCWITLDALRLLDRLDKAFSEAHDTAFRGLNAKDRPAFIRRLEAIRAAHDP